MIISTFNTEVQCTGKDNQQIDIKFSSSALQQVEGFTTSWSFYLLYLEGTTCADSTCDKDITRWTELAADIVRMLQKIGSADDIP